MNTLDLRAVSTAMAALELLPAEPSDLTNILRDTKFRGMLLGEVAATAQGDVDPASLGASPLVAYLLNHMKPTRVQEWLIELQELHGRSAVRAVLAGSSGYPDKLAKCWDAPPILYTMGTAPGGPHVAIVGSRSAASNILSDARELASELASLGVTVVSGLAAGIDSAAHQGCLDAGGKTVAVMGTGIRTIYPETNVALSQQIAQNGMLVSQFAPRAPRTSTTFLRRNCVIAGMCDVSIIMDGRARSGSKHEFEQAISYGRVALMWAPALEQEAWAQDFRSRGLARFVSSLEEIWTAVKDFQ
ncbi:DNA-processing protein DprA [Nocardia sp. NPDC050697]|uniref:DNA-processing protein DprA n=1 Tax=Nocardia sp. NPDC050697 TaxID=3155158 RepID=UPI0033C59E74